MLDQCMKVWSNFVMKTFLCASAMLALRESENDHNVMITNVININIPASVCGSLVGSNKNPFVVVTSSIGVRSTQV